MQRKKIFLLFIWTLLFLNGVMHVNFINATPSDIQLEKIGEIDTDGQVMDVVVRNNIAFIADDDNGFYIYNVIDNSNPIEIFHDPAAAGANGIEIVDDLAYLGILFGGLKIYNISNLVAPIFIGNYENTGAIVDVQVLNEIAYLSDHGSPQSGSGGNILVNVSDPYNPFRISKFDGGGKPSNVFVDNQIIYSADYSYGYEILNASDPSNIQLIRRIGLDPGYFGVYVSNGYAYFTNNNNHEGLYIYDVRNLSNISFVDSFSMGGGNPCDLQVENNLAYIADGETGLNIVNVSDPTAPELLWQLSDGGQPFDVEVSDNIVYVADMEEGVKIFEFRDSNQQNISGYHGGLFTLLILPIFFGAYRIKKRT